MRSGLLWYDADAQKPLSVKIEEAAQRYYQKFGVRPNTCYVNPGDVPTTPTAPPQGLAASAVLVLTKATILPNHIWLGVRES